VSRAQHAYFGLAKKFMRFCSAAYGGSSEAIKSNRGLGGLSS
jgi:hypothetical protein